MNDSSHSHRADAGRQPAPGSAEKLGQLRELLREMFQLDRGDLDFGLYRIMNMKAEEVGKFLDDDLLPQVQEKLQGISAEDRANLENDLREALRTARELGVPNPEEATKVRNLRRQLAEAQADADAEADVYGHLASFFARYYAEGDFVSQRRYSGGGRSAYLIPYDGEEVKLHWANADQYYVKTTESYASYAFTVDDGRRVRFEVSAAHTEKDNNKEAPGKPRRFVLGNQNPVVVSDNELIVRFDHRPLADAEKKQYGGNVSRQQDRINAVTADRVMNADALDAEWRAQLAAFAPTDANGERTVLTKHIDRYTAKNTFDYFIHKDLGGFLRRELEFYLKAEVMNLDDLALGDAGRLRRALARMRTIRFVGDKIIAFLAQLEDFQKRLWLKKKLVLETQWCVTLDRVPEDMYAEIAANEAQRKEWVELFAIDEIMGDLGNGGLSYTEPMTAAFVKANRNLVLDTRHFSADFKDRLLTILSADQSLDRRTDGLLIRGENFQALSFLQATHRGKVQCVYIDPPYNTDATPISYKNGYRHSSWLSLIDSRIELTHPVMAKDAILCVTIDDFESHHLREQFSVALPSYELLGTVAIKNNPAGRTGTVGFSICHEYALFYGQPEFARVGRLEHSESQKARYKERDELGAFEWTNFRKHGGANTYRTTRPRQFYPIYVTADGRIRVPQMEWDESARSWRLLEDPNSNEEAILPIDGSGRERIWDFTVGTTIKNLAHLQVRTDSSGRRAIYRKWRLHSEGLLPQTIWDRSKYSAAEYGTKLLTNLFGETHRFSFPKSVHAVADCLRAANFLSLTDGVVLDYFAGSGTTAHAVVDLNRADGGKRKCVSVEMADYFESVLLPRIKKVVYSADWQDGKPVSRDSGDSYLAKYLALESYEDTLDCLEFRPPPTDLLSENTALGEDYRLRYALGVETAGSACLLGHTFKDPFSYKLSVVRDGARSEVAVDLPESFNYLIGLEVETRRRLGGVLATTGVDSIGKRCLVLWRNADEVDNDALETWFREHRGSLGTSFDCVYANGDQTLNAIRLDDERWTAKPIEPLFRELMFEGAS